MNRPHHIGPIMAVVSAALFGVSPVLVKVAVGELHPVFLAALLYFGSSAGLLIFRFFQKNGSLSELTALSQRQRGMLFGSVLSGGILAPICLVYGIREATAFEASVLLNLETVVTTLIAWLIFHENVGSRVWIGKSFLLFGALLIAVTPKIGLSFSPGGIYLIAASIFWAVDNNLTREVDTLSPSILGTFKSLTSATFMGILAWLIGGTQGEWGSVGETLLIGALSYGLSLVLFIESLRKLGASRTSTYFAINPFFGMIFALLFLGEHPKAIQWVSAFVMLIGIILLYFEHHEHSHTHEPLAHRHRHIHDEHHQHAHDGTEGPEPHEHFHIHDPITHNHVHSPDIHHRHTHHT